jgi:hypothetical protein
MPVSFDKIDTTFASLFGGVERVDGVYEVEEADDLRRLPVNLLNQLNQLNLLTT